jgi:hypothetical protein
MAVTLTALAVATTTAFFQSSRRVLKDQLLEIETTQAARSVVDMIVRELRLGGACLPVTGTFMSLQAVNTAAEDEIITRTGLVRPDLSCVRTATNTPNNPDGTPNDTPAQGSTIAVQSTDGFSTGMRAYIRGATDGEYFKITSVDSQNGVLGRDRSFQSSYPNGSGVYAIDERRFYINHWQAPWGDTPELMLQIGEQEPLSFAVGIERLSLQYQLKRNCPNCDVVDLPQGDEEWRLVEQVLLTVTARSDHLNHDGQAFRRTYTVAVKPRNLLPQ